MVPGMTIPERSTPSESHSDHFTKLFVECYQTLHGYIRRFVGSSETAKEIAQEAFLRTYRQGDAVKAARAFLFSTAHNLAAKEYRHRKVEERQKWKVEEHQRWGGIGDSGVDIGHESAEAEVLTQEWNQLIREAIGRLPPQCRAAFTLHIFHDLSHREIADRLGISSKTVEKHVARGLHQTHAYLKRRYNATRA